MTTSIRLKEWRLRKALSQRELANLAGVTQSTVALIEVGRRSPRPTTIRKLARALRLDPAKLFRIPPT
ncbi:MAG: helix-turn-helix transcriptional regulator [Dehalococcoidia bacterium]|nr:helix-turn-helix transcriptional regulator [Dehalococcoidia bacterium]